MASPSWMVRDYHGWHAYAGATGLVALITAVRVALGGILLHDVPFLPFVLAVLGSSLIGGLNVGLYATLLSAIVGETLFVHPSGVVAFSDLTETVRLGLFLLAGTVTSTIVELLRQARTEAQRANEEKDAFIAMVAHEFRNPINAIQTALAATACKYTEERRQWAREMVERQITVMSRLVDDLVDTARIRRHAFEHIQSQPTALLPIIESAIASIRPLIEERHLRLTADLKDDAMVFVDPMRLQQAIGNLLSNACRYTPADGQVSISLEITNTATLTIRDTGIGISPTDLTRLFEPFQRGPQSTGLGLGLFLARTFVQYSGGTLDAVSPGAGQGSTFVIRLPLLQEQGFPQDVLPDMHSAGA